MAQIEAELADALNRLLEDERACVEIELALANGATEIRERTAFTEMGCGAVLACCALRERLTEGGSEVTWRINGIVLQLLEMDRYDDRLRAFAQHLVTVTDGVRALLGQVRDGEVQKVLEEIYEGHVRHAVWCERRAEEFAATRFLDFRAPAPDVRARLGEVEVEDADVSYQNRPPEQTGETDASFEPGQEPDPEPNHAGAAMNGDAWRAPAQSRRGRGAAEQEASPEEQPDDADL